jgi:dUTP pyrophosphatase
MNEKNDNGYQDMINEILKEYNDNITHTNSVNVDNDFFKIKVNILNKSRNENPEFQTEGSAGFDIRADIDDDIVLSPQGNDGAISIINTGLYLEIPENFELQIRPRSGLAAKHGVTVLNSPGTIDSDFRGELKIILINHSNEPFTIKSGDRIAQGVFSSVYGKKILKFINVDKLTITERNDNGFGSTGTK